jgi:Cu+-exporting ATPase
MTRLASVIVAVIFSLPLFCLALAPGAALVALLLPDVLNPYTSPARFALLQPLLLLPVMTVGRRILQDGLASLVRRPNLNSLIAVVTLVALSFSVYILLDMLLRPSSPDSFQRLEYLQFAPVALLLTFAVLGDYLEFRLNAAGNIRHSRRHTLPIADSQQADRLARQVLLVASLLAVTVGVAWYLVAYLGFWPVPAALTKLEFAAFLAISVLVVACPAGLALATPVAIISLARSGAALGIHIKGDIGLASTKYIDTIILDKTGVLTEGKPTVVDIVPISKTRPEDALFQLRAVDDVLSAGLGRTPGVDAAGAATAGGAGVPGAAAAGAAGAGAAGAVLNGIPQPESIISSQSNLLFKQEFDRVLFDLVGDNQAMTQIVHGQKKQLLALAAAAEIGSDHPLGRAIVREAQRRSLALDKASAVQARPGLGVAAIVNNQQVLIGSRKLLLEHNIDLKHLESIAAGLAEEAKTPIYIAADGSPIGIITATDRLRTTSRMAVQGLKAAGFRIIMLTGDNPRTAAAIAATLEIDEVMAEVLPWDKVAALAEQQSHGRKVALVSCGDDDGQALRRANLGIVIKADDAHGNSSAAGAAGAGAVGTAGGAAAGAAGAAGAGAGAAGSAEPTAASGAARTAAEDADILLTNSDLSNLLRAITFSQRTLSGIGSNLLLASLFNLLLLPVAAGLAYLLGGGLLDLRFLGISLLLSLLSLLINCLRLRHGQLSP